MRMRTFTVLALAALFVGGCGGFWDSYTFHPNAPTSAPDPGRP